MAFTSNPQGQARYARGLVLLHWFMLLLLAATYACIELREFWPRGTPMRVGLKDAHFAIGLAVFALLWLRLALRFFGATPPITPAPAHWQAALSKAMHLLLYAFMIAMPLLGWLVLSAEGELPVWFGIGLPPLIGVDENLAHELEGLHETIGVAGYWLIGVHAAAALFHHYVLRDDTLRRMGLRRLPEVRTAG